MSPQIDITVAVKTTTPNTPDDFNISFNFNDVAVVTWKEVTNSDIAFYEIRRDNYPGVKM